MRQGAFIGAGVALMNSPLSLSRSLWQFKQPKGSTYLQNPGAAASQELNFACGIPFRLRAGVEALNDCTLTKLRHGNHARV